jgi:tungstate transport system ATP-binding protein
LNLEHLSIEKGKIYALIGANGAGKSTLLNLLAFLEKPTSGEVRCCGELVHYRRQQLLNLRRRIVLVDQYPIHFTGPVCKNVSFGLRVRGISKKLREKRVDEVLKLVGMEAFRWADSHKLSGGESKRIALARALAIEPEVLLCDELTANVDVENREIILNILERINKEKQTSIIIATHYLSQIRRLAHHTLVLEYGSILDTAHENIFRCQEIKKEEGFLVCGLDNEVHVYLPQNQFQEIKKYCRIHINPKGIKFLLKDEQTKQKNILTGQIIKIEQKQDAICLTVDCGIKLHAMLTMNEYLQQPLMIGENRRVSFSDTSILLL